jgi:hypothetical protein
MLPPWFLQLPVALVLLFSGAVKAVDAGRFASHLRRFGFLTEHRLLTATIAAAGLECAFAVALLVYISPAIDAIGIALFIAFIAFTLWGAATKRIEDCGCYGNQVNLTPGQSAALDFVYIALLIAALWLSRARPAWILPLGWYLVALAGATGAALAEKSGKAPLVDLSRLRIGARWRRSWLLKEGDHDLGKGSHIVVFLSNTCPFCKQWVPLLNILETQTDLPRVTGILNLNEAEVERFSREYLTRFPLSRMKTSVFSNMVDGVPTAALLEDGVIMQKWSGKIPPELFSRIEQFYNAVATLPARPHMTRRFSG